MSRGRGNLPGSGTEYKGRRKSKGAGATLVEERVGERKKNYIEGDDGSDCRSRRIRSDEGIMRTMPLCLPAVTQGFIPAAKQSLSIGQHRSHFHAF